jgi:hypothetical protein
VYLAQPKDAHDCAILENITLAARGWWEAEGKGYGWYWKEQALLLWRLKHSQLPKEIHRNAMEI